MKKQDTRDIYRDRINVVTAYVDRHLGEKLELSRMAEMAHLSPFHFHRVARVMLKQPFGEYVTRLRVEAAAKLLRYSDKAIFEIAYEVGFEMPSSLSKRFKKYYGITPRQYREDLELYIQAPIALERTEPISPLKIETRTDQTLAYVRLTGDYAEMDFGGASQELMAFAMQNQLIDETTQWLGLSFDDPHVTGTGQCRYDVSLTTRMDFKPKQSVGKKILEGGRYAVFEHRGPYEQIDRTYDAIYGHWFFESGHTLRHAPSFDLYVSHMQHTPPADLITHVHIPIE